MTRPPNIQDLNKAFLEYETNSLKIKLKLSRQHLLKKIQKII